MIKEFKKFILRGNVMDLAVGVIIGAAFNKIVSSLVGDIISPLLTIFIGKIDLTALTFTVINSEIRVGAFLVTIIDFLITGTSIFIIIKSINTLNEKNPLKKGKKEEQAPTTKKCPYCITDIAIKAVRCPNCTSDLAEQ